MSLPTLVKLEIVELIRELFAGLSMVGVSAVFDTGDSQEEIGDRIVQAITNGKFALVITVGADAIGGENPERQLHHNVNEWEFGVDVIIHFPTELPLVDDDDPDAGRMRPDQAAAWVHAEMLRAYTNPNVDPFAGKALWVECQGGGGVYLHPASSALLSDHSLIVRYRHRTGDPGVAA